MSTAMAHPSTKNGLALVIMALSMFLLSVGDVTVRYIGATVPAGQLIAIRGVILIMILMLMMRVMRGRRLRMHQLLGK